jgi:hypothetical protein
MTSADPDLARAMRDLDTMAAEVTGRLAELRRVLEPTRDLWSGGGLDLGPADEWSIAVDGLFGDDGVLGQISRALEAAAPVGGDHVSSRP